jgi:hypothetical protein
MREANALAPRNEPDDSDGEFPSVRRLLSHEYRLKSMEEGSLMQEDTTGKKVWKPWIISSDLRQQLKVAKVGVLSATLEYLLIPL